MTERTPLEILIDAMAARSVADYLTPKPAPEQADAPERTDRVPLPATDKAA